MKNKITLTKDNIKILICCHKSCELPPNPDGIFLPIQVGAAISDVDLGMQSDDQLNGTPCDNISAKNKSYCELTALYWAWKNIKKIYPDLEYIGLNHYRRYFKFKLFSRIADFKSEKDVLQYKLNKKSILHTLQCKKSIISKQNYYPYCLAVDYCTCHISEDLHAVEKIVHELYPEYDSVMYDFFYKNNKLSHYNMFISTWDLFDKYCTWLFSILAEAEKRIDISNYNEVQKRIWGYLAERLFNVYLIKNKINVKKLPLFVFNNKKESYVHYILNRLRYNLGFKLTKRK